MSLGASVFGPGVSSGFGTEPAEGELAATDMSLSTLLLHDVHHRHVSLTKLFCSILMITMLCNALAPAFCLIIAAKKRLPGECRPSFVAEAPP